MSVRVISFEEMSRAARAGRGEKLVVGVERLLQWAYAQELVHMARPQGTPADLGGARSYSTGLAAGADVSSLGTFVDTSRNMGFEAARDAYEIAKRVAWLGDVECELPEASYGRSIVRGLVPEVETRFALHLPSLVFMHASRCERPDWIARPMLAVERGRTLTGAGFRGRRIVVMQEVKFRGDAPWEVAKARLVYLAWVDALTALARALAGKLDRFESAVDGIERSPWASRD